MLKGCSNGAAKYPLALPHDHASPGTFRYLVYFQSLCHALQRAWRGFVIPKCSNLSLCRQAVTVDFSD
jgi:hypothetical protein